MSFLKHLLPAWKRNLDSGSTNAAILSALDVELSEAEKDAIEGKVVMALEDSTGIWLDQYGKLFGVIRKDDEVDEDYRDRIIGYIKLERGTIPAVKDAVRQFLQDYQSHIDIYEPFNNVFVLNKSKLNGRDHFLGNYYRTAVIDITFTEVFPIAIVDTINEFKAAGVKVHLTRQPKAYNPTAPIFTVTTAGDTIQKALELQGNRDRSYISIANSDIIGYKRVHRFSLARPLSDTEDVNNPPYPVVMYGNKPWVLVPREQAIAENAHWVYVSVTVDNEVFSNQAYSDVGLYINLVPTDKVLDTLTPEEVADTGEELLIDSRTLQERGDSVQILEQFMIEIIN